MLIPKLLTTLRGYTRAQLAADLTAGVIVGIVARRRDRDGRDHSGGRPAFATPTVRREGSTP